MKIIVAKNGSEIQVDDLDYEILKDYTWYDSPEGYCTAYIAGRIVKMHRLILTAPKGKIVDHIDTNPRNNCRSNLRLVTAYENAQNRKKNKNKKYKGVSFKKEMNCYVSQLIAFDKKYFIGYFKSEIAAAYAYNKKAKEVSEFIFLNEFEIPEEELEFILEIDRIHKTRWTAEKRSSQEGVYWHKALKGKKHGFWEVKIHINGKRRNVGSFFREEDAIRAYLAAKNQLSRTKQLNLFE